MAEKAEIEVFRTLLGIVGVGVGVVTVIAAFASPSYEGRVYFFLPAIIFGVIGMLVGTVIDKIATAIRDQLGSRPHRLLSVHRLEDHNMLKVRVALGFAPNAAWVFP